jgi:hypothetical protein
VKNIPLYAAKKIPNCFYRGVHGENIKQALENPFSRTHNRLPTFSDSCDIAQAYATDPNDGDEALESSVGMYKLEINNPAYVPIRISFKEIKESLRIKSQKSKEFINLVHSLNWIIDGDEFVGLIDDLEKNSENVYALSYELCDHSDYIKLLKDSGYDGIISEGDFSSSHLFLRDLSVVEKSSSYDSSEDSAIEYRVFDITQVKPFFSENHLSVSPQIRVLVNKFIEDYGGPLSLSDIENTKSKGSIVSENLAKFLYDHKVNAKLILTQGKNNEEGGLSLVHSAVSIDNLIVDLYNDPINNKHSLFSNRESHLSKWKWLISEREPNLELSEESEMSI